VTLAVRFCGISWIIQASPGIHPQSRVQSEGSVGAGQVGGTKVTWLNLDPFLTCS
jgi:hypothetical protein